MKKVISVVALLMATLMIAACLTACGNKLSNGTYKLVEYTDADGNDNMKYAEMLKIDEFEVKDGKATLMGQEWDVKDGKLVCGDEEQSYKIKGKKVEFTGGEGTMIFEKQ